MTHPLDGARLKLERAREHAHVLDEEIHGFLKTDPYVIEPKRDFKDGKHILRAFFKPTAKPPQRLGLLAGDAIHNLRCALDYIVYETVQLLPAKDRPRKPAYPLVTTNAADYRRDVLPWLSHLPGPKRKFIRSLQPYRCGYPVKQHPLVQLNSSWNRDKHRVLNTYFAQVSTQTSRVWGTDISAIHEIKQFTGPVKNQRQLVKMVYASTGGDDVHIEINLTMDISLSDGLPIRRLLNDAEALIKLHLFVLDPIF